MKGDEREKKKMGLFTELEGRSEPFVSHDMATRLSNRSTAREQTWKTHHFHELKREPVSSRRMPRECIRGFMLCLHMQMLWESSPSLPQPDSLLSLAHAALSDESWPRP